MKNQKDKFMTNKMMMVRAGLTGVVLGLTACGTTGTTAVSGGATVPAQGPAPATLGTGAVYIEAALPLVRTGAAVATGAVLDFAVKQSTTRTRLANEMYAAANAVYALSGGTFPAPAQFEGSIRAFGGSQADANYAQFSTAIAGLYAAYYPRLATGDAKSAADLLNAIAGGIEDATQAYVTVPGAVASGTGGAGPNLQIFQINEIGETEILTGKHEGRKYMKKARELGCREGSEAALTSAFPSATWERGGGEPLSF
jgi:hypothetical protein